MIPKKSPFGALAVALAVFGGICGGPSTAHAQVVPTSAGTSALEGKIFAADGKTPLEGARVMAYHLSTERMFQSEPTDSKGGYEITALPYGYFDLAVETPNGLFVGNQVINLPPNGKMAVVFTAVPFEPGTRAQARKFPGTEGDPSGLAEVQEKQRGREFWRSPKGVAIIAGAGGVALLALAGGSDDPASPFNP